MDKALEKGQCNAGQLTSHFPISKTTRGLIRFLSIKLAMKICRGVQRHDLAGNLTSPVHLYAYMYLLCTGTICTRTAQTSVLLHVPSNRTK